MMAKTPAVHTSPRRVATYQWMTMDDFCTELGVASSTAYKWSASGPRSRRFPRFRKLPNGSIRIRRDWFDEWLEQLGPGLYP